MVDDGNLLTVPGEVKVPDVSAVEQDSAVRRIVESFYERDCRGLSRTTHPTEGDHSFLVRVKCEGDTFQNLDVLTGGVGELQIFNLQSSVDRVVTQLCSSFKLYSRFIP